VLPAMSSSGSRCVSTRIPRPPPAHPNAPSSARTSRSPGESRGRCCPGRRTPLAARPRNRPRARRLADA
jgi:hypothetical protein